MKGESSGSAAASAGHWLTLTDALILGQTVAWAGHFILAKDLLLLLQPMSFWTIRIGLCAVMIIIAAAAQRQSLLPERRDWPAMAMLGLIGHTTYQSCAIVGLALTSAGNAALLYALSPIFAAIIATLTGQERPGWHGWTGVGLSFSGAAIVIVGSGRQAGFDAAGLTGDLLCIAAAVALAVYYVWQRRYVARYTPFEFNAITMSVGAPAMLLIAAPGMLTDTWQRVTPIDWWWIGYSAALAFWGNIAWTFGVKHLGAAKTLAYSYAPPVLASLFAWWLRDEPLTAGLIVGAPLIFGGVWLVRRG